MNSFYDTSRDEPDRPIAQMDDESLRTGGSAKALDTIPKEETIDATRAFFQEGYRFVSNRCERFGSDIFETRLLGGPAICMRGAQAAEMFYEPERMTRKGALPMSTLKLLQDKGSVATLDGPAHHHRKAMFLDLLSPAHAEAIARRAAEELETRAAAWPRLHRVRLIDEFHTILGQAIFEWAKVPVPRDELPRLIDELAAMIANSGTVGPKNWWARARRRRAERKIRRAVDRVRAGFIEAEQESPFSQIVWHRDLNGHLLPPETCVVELLNILRPTVAIARFMVFAVHALSQRPDMRDRVAKDADFAHAFVQEVRRVYPFFPVVGGVARQAFEWRGHHFEKGRFFLLDLYGTNHHSALWPDPEDFQPERFVTREPSPFDLIPQGAGDPAQDHRCAGEWVTIAVMTKLIGVFAEKIDYRPSSQDDSIDLQEMPAGPQSGMTIKDARLCH